MDICIISGHQGSSAWQEMIEKFSIKYSGSYIVKGLSDEKFRKTGRLNRFLNRFYIFILYPLKIIFSLKKIKRHKKIIVISSPFFLPLMMCFLVKRENLVIFQNDLYPEGLRSVPVLKNKIFFKFFRKYSDKYYAQCLNIFISNTLKLQRSYPRTEVLYTPSSRGQKKYNSSKTNNISIGYIGSLGYYHFGDGFLKMLKNSDFEVPTELYFRISGSSSRKFRDKSKKIKNINNLKEFNVCGSLDSNEFQKIMNSLHYGLVLMDENSSSINFPSKFPSYLSFGLPVILISDQKNEIHDLILENDVGISINLKEKNLNSLNNFFNENNYSNLSENSLELFEMNFSSNTVSESFFKIISKYD